MLDNPYTMDELMALTRDQEFQRRIATDPLLDEYEKPVDELRDAAESAMALGGGVTLAGVHLPPPRLGHIRLLATVGSDFVKSTRQFADLAREVVTALFVLHYGHRAVEPVANRFRFQRALAKYTQEATGEQLEKILAAERGLANELAHWDNALTRFALQIRMRPGETMADIAVELDRYLASAWTGLELIPRAGDEDEDPQKKTSPRSRPTGKHSLFEWLASACRRSRTGMCGGASRS